MIKTTKKADVFVINCRGVKRTQNKTKDIPVVNIIHLLSSMDFVIKVFH